MWAGLKDGIVYSFFDPKIGVLKDMIALITPDQFYDPGLRCFVFPDYLLGPLMEDYAGILGIQIRNQILFYVTKEEPDIVEISRALYLSPEVIKKGLKEKWNLPGFHLSFLEAKAKEYVVLGDWKAVCALLAVSIYGIILFPNQKNFIDINAIRLYITWLSWRR